MKKNIQAKFFSANTMEINEPKFFLRKMQKMEKKNIHNFLFFVIFSRKMSNTN